MSKSQTLKEINEQKRALTEQQRKIREELMASKEERKEARRKQSELRKVIKAEKAELRSMFAKVNKVLVSGDSQELYDMAAAIQECSTSLVQSIDKFGDTLKVM